MFSNIKLSDRFLSSQERLPSVPSTRPLNIGFNATSKTKHISEFQLPLLFLQDMPRHNLEQLYASIVVGDSACHGFTQTPGHTGGFYHLVCDMG